MGEVKGFLKYGRKDLKKKLVEERLKNWNEFTESLAEQDLKNQGARCMDCGVPFCHWGCPVSNIIPDWNDLVYQGRWKEALDVLSSTNNFPEVTGRVCPAPCENSCVLAINDPAVTIKNIEAAIAEKGFQEGWTKPRPPKKRTGKTVAIIGSGPAGLACADLLNGSGHQVTVYEKNEVLGGLMTLGIPTYKLEKTVVERRLAILEKEGIKFKTKVNIGVNVSADELKKKFDAVVLCGGAEQPRDLQVDGRDLQGIYFAMDFLTQQTRVNLGFKIDKENRIDVKGKKVVILGGGDTGSDCIGTANRQGAASVTQFELLPEPPKERDADNPWPQWAAIKRVSTSQEEGCDVHYCVMTKNFIGEGGKLKKLKAVRVAFGAKDPETGRSPMKEVEGSEFEIDCDYVFLAMGFLGPCKEGMIKELGVALDARGNIKTDITYMSSIEGVFSAGDMRTGQSLVVRAIDEGRNAALSVHKWLSK